MSSSTHEFVDRYLRETAEIALATSRQDVARVIDVLFGAYLEDRTIFTCGNGGWSVHFAPLLATPPSLRRVALTEREAT